MKKVVIVTDIYIYIYVCVCVGGGGVGVYIYIFIVDKINITNINDIHNILTVIVKFIIGVNVIIKM